MADTHRPSVVFFDIGQTLGVPRFDGGRLAGLDLFDGVPVALHACRDAGCRLGVISDIGPVTAAAVADVEAALRGAGILDDFEPALRIFGPKDATAIFDRAADAAGLKRHPDRCLFVGENASERAVATAAGFRVAEDVSGAFTVVSPPAPSSGA